MKGIACLFLAVSVVSAGSPIRRAPARTASLSNPFDENERAQRAGAKLYARDCAACHGANREGLGKAPSLNRTEVLSGLARDTVLGAAKRLDLARDAVL